MAGVDVVLHFRDADYSAIRKAAERVRVSVEAFVSLAIFVATDAALDSAITAAIKKRQVRSRNFKAGEV